LEQAAVVVFAIVCGGRREMDGRLLLGGEHGGIKLQVLRREGQRRLQGVELLVVL
jgi:hypothetical protein